MPQKRNKPQGFGMARVSPVSEKHRQELKSSGISDRLIDRNFATLTDPREIDQFLNRNTDSRWKHGQLTSGWRVAGVDPRNGEYRGIGGQFKPDNPRTNQDGKTIKYESISGLDAVPLFLDTGDRTYWQTVINDPLTPIVITEGAKKAGCVLSQGIACISIAGVTNGQKLGELRDDLKLFCQVGRTVYLAFDMDLHSKPQVAQALDKLGRLLCASGCVVKVLMWDEAHKGIDDYLVATGESLVTLIEKAWTFERWRKEFVPQPKGDRSEEKAPKVFDLLMKIVPEFELYKQDNEFGLTYADVVVDGIRRTYRLRSGEFKAWLTRELYIRHQKPANSEALENCLKICEGQAMNTIKQVWLKVAEDDGKVYLDLCNEKWQAIEVSKQGWRVVESQDLPVRFVRSPMQNPLPTPTHSDTADIQILERLWQILPFAEESKPLVIAWLLSCLTPTGDKPILVLCAPKGSGKSTIARFLVNLIDATKSALLPAVGDRGALAVQSQHRWIFAFDNLSNLSVEQQDAMCCTSTGAGHMKRRLYSDDDVSFTEYRRPQILTSVDLVPTRSDLLDRCLLVKLKPIPECDRKTNEELDQMFQDCHAEVLGALLSLLSIALRNMDSVKQPLQRMASFHRLGLSAGIPNFHETYLSSIGKAQQEAVRANPISDAIAELGNFHGTAQELVTKLKDISDDPKVQKLSSRSLGKLLNGTLKTDLEAIGIEIDTYREQDKKRTRKIMIQQTDRQTKQMSEMSMSSSANPETAQAKDFSSGHQSGHHEDMKSSLPNKCPNSEPVWEKGFTPLSDNSDIMDMKNCHLSVSSADDHCPEDGEEF